MELHDRHPMAGTHSFTATDTVADDESGASAALTVTVDTTDPTSSDSVGQTHSAHASARGLHSPIGKLIDRPPLMAFLALQARPHPITPSICPLHPPPQVMQSGLPKASDSVTHAISPDTGFASNATDAPKPDWSDAARIYIPTRQRRQAGSKTIPSNRIQTSPSDRIVTAVHLGRIIRCRLKPSAPTQSSARRRRSLQSSRQQRTRSKFAGSLSRSQTHSYLSLILETSRSKAQIRRLTRLIRMTCSDISPNFTPNYMLQP